MQESITAGVAKAGVPEMTVDRCDKSLRVMRRWDAMGSAQGVQLAGGITSEERHLGLKILDGETPRVKFDRHRIISS
jgi:hypothetical protein